MYINPNLSPNLSLLHHIQNYVLGRCFLITGKIENFFHVYLRSFFYKVVCLFLIYKTIFIEL